MNGIGMTENWIDGIDRMDGIDGIYEINRMN